MDHFQHCEWYTGSDTHAGSCLGTRLSVYIYIDSFLQQFPQVHKPTIARPQLHIAFSITHWGNTKYVLRLCWW